MSKKVKGFSRWSRDEKIAWLKQEVFTESSGETEFAGLDRFWLKSDQDQKLVEEFSENTVTSFPIPYGVLPSIVINGKDHTVPMAIEESSVVAAASASAKFWNRRGGFKAEVLSVKKSGQLHCECALEASTLRNWFLDQKRSLLDHLNPFTERMRARGGGIVKLELLDKTDLMENYFQLDMQFETCDAMGANFINTVLEQAGRWVKTTFEQDFGDAQQFDVIMAILSNYTPECLVHVQVACPIENLADAKHEMGPFDFAKKFQRAVRIAEIEPKRAVTHNKGIFNGVDAVILATGNDFRATEACGHAYAARDGQYRGLTKCDIKEGQFSFSLTLPLSVGTVGGLTTLHPLVKKSMEMLQHPSARDLMMVAAAVGLAQNFGALRSLVTVGIQRGHMKMHLLNLLRGQDASDEEVRLAKEHFKDRIISANEVTRFLQKKRKS